MSDDTAWVGEEVERFLRSTETQEELVAFLAGTAHLLAPRLEMAVWLVRRELLQWASTDERARLVAAVIQRLPLDSALRQALLDGAVARNPAFARFRSEPATLLLPPPGERAAYLLARLVPDERGLVLEYVLRHLAGRFATTGSRPTRGGARRSNGGGAAPPREEVKEEEEPAPPGAVEEAPPPGSAPVRERKPVYVDNGFADEQEPDGSVRGMSLGAGRRYWFWLEVGEERVEGSIVSTRVELDRDNLPEGAVITVVLFPVGEEGFRVAPGADLGELRLAEDGSVEVARQPHGAPTGGGRPRRLRFGVRAPDAPGEHRLRANLYHRQTLLQSWLVRARVDAEPRDDAGALRADLDYVLSRTLASGRVARLSPHRLSLLMNSNGDGSHSFFFAGEQEFRSQATLDGQALQDLLDETRKALRRAAWGSEASWTGGEGYRYADGKLDRERLRADLVSLALKGRLFHHTLANRLAGSREQALALRELMRTPGLVQVANRRHAAHVVPAALLYDYPALDRGAPPGTAYTLCPEFLKGLDDPRRPLEEHPCFTGGCPSTRERLVVCPSGFWGYRHALGMPLSIGEDADTAGEEIAYAGAPALAVAVWRDFERRAAHETALRGLRADLGWEYADTRQEALEMLEKTRSPIVYFYCHGGMQGSTPYLLVGGKDEGYLDVTNFGDGIAWPEPGPLVFINGCQTAALEPEKAFDFVSTLVESANAAGVIGTEITVFEPLATEFAEEFLRRFVVPDAQGETLGVGEAVRRARLALLQRGNPLGLVYLPFAMAGLRLVPRPD
ncbi:MAG TPA: C25 family cysteine peptidase [Longimicrobiaceae bacterium]|nr:C25 family cysteine peptidase [Longimicrobiaceae bacterium]